MRTQTTIVQLRVGKLRGPLELKRAPKFLRFVLVGTDWKTLDALDQPSDVPKPEESVYAAVKDESASGSVHIDGVRNGRRFGEWRQTAVYRLVDPQPPQDVLRDRDKWIDWCYSQPGAPPRPSVATIPSAAPAAGEVSAGAGASAEAPPETTS